MVTDNSQRCGPDFESIFAEPGQTPGRGPATHTAEAPGRVNLIGEHTDYNDGFVLPTVIPQKTQVFMRARSDRRVRLYSSTLNRDKAPLSYALGEERRSGGWIDYVQGVTQALAQAGYGERLRGFDLAVVSTIPAGSGLSSSAALEVSVLRALRSLFALPLTAVALAELGQRAENQLVGTPCGIMDQLAVSLCPEGAALFIDTRTRQMRPVALPRELALIVIHSGVTHRLADTQSGNDYKTRRAECEQAARQLGVEALRDVPDSEPTRQRLSALPEPLGRRARHVITENTRVQQAVAALEAGDVRALGAILQDGHRSLRDDFAVSIPELDLLVELGNRDPDVLGARLTGGGFGGSVVMLGQKSTARAAAARICVAYAAQTGQAPVILLPQPESADGR